MDNFRNFLVLLKVMDLCQKKSGENLTAVVNSLKMSIVAIGLWSIRKGETKGS